MQDLVLLTHDRKTVPSFAYSRVASDLVGNHDRDAGFVEHVKESHPCQEHERRGVHDATEDHAGPPLSVPRH